MFRSGLFLIAFSFLPWMIIPFVPWLPLLNSAKDKAGVVAGLFVLAEVIFWTGILFAGKDTWTVIKLHGWKQAPKKFFELLKNGK